MIINGWVDCIEYRKNMQSGYGRRYIDGQRLYAHRVEYEKKFGSIPQGMQIDHLCRNRSCINTDHLECVTQQENIRRGMAPNVVIARTGMCRNGHPRSESVIRAGTNEVVYCKPCRREKRRNDR